MDRKLTSQKYFIIILAIFLFAFLFQHYVIYKHLIVPQLSGIKSVPMLWWAGYMLPVVIAAVFAGYLSRGIKEILITSLFASVIYNLFVFFLAKSNEPGFIKGVFLPNFIKGFLVFIFVFFILLLVGYVGNRLMSVPRKNKCG